MEVDHEQEIVKAFFTPGRRARYLGLLSTPRGRRKFISSLPHLDALDSRFGRGFDPREQNVDRIEDLLGERGTPDLCYVISENSRLDLQRMKLHDALQRLWDLGWALFFPASQADLHTSRVKMWAQATSASGLREAGNGWVIAPRVAHPGPLCYTPRRWPSGRPIYFSIYLPMSLDSSWCAG
jgi:hypothetical protein